MVAKKKTTASWGKAPEATPTQTAPEGVPDENGDFTPPEFLKNSTVADTTADPAQTELEDAIAATKPDEPAATMEEWKEAEVETSVAPDPDATLGTLENPSTPPVPEKPKKAKAATPIPSVDTPGDNARNALTSFVERIERLGEEAVTIRDDIKEVFGEAKAAGFEVKIMREAIRRRKMDPNARDEHDSLLAIYEDALR